MEKIDIIFFTLFFGEIRFFKIIIIDDLSHFHIVLGFTFLESAKNRDHGIVLVYQEKFDS